MDSISKRELREHTAEIYGDFVASETESIERMDAADDPDGFLRAVLSYSQGAQSALNTLGERLGIYTWTMDPG